jgi:hypothetical protein
LGGLLRARGRGVLALALAALALGGCGGASESTSPDFSTGASAVSGAHVARANRICAEMIADARRIDVRFRRAPHAGIDLLTLTTERLVKPAIPLLEASSARLRALEVANVNFESYVALFDPIVSLARDRAGAGEAGDSDRAHILELLLLELGSLQHRLAHKAGLKACDVDFIRIFSSPKG